MSLHALHITQQHLFSRYNSPTPVQTVDALLTLQNKSPANPAPISAEILLFPRLRPTNPHPQICLPVGTVKTPFFYLNPTCPFSAQPSIPQLGFSKTRPSLQPQA